MSINNPNIPDQEQLLSNSYWNLLNYDALIHSAAYKPITVAYNYSEYPQQLKNDQKANAKSCEEGVNPSGYLIKSHDFNYEQRLETAQTVASNFYKAYRTLENELLSEIEKNSQKNDNLKVYEKLKGACMKQSRQVQAHSSETSFLKEANNIKTNDQSLNYNLVPRTQSGQSDVTFLTGSCTRTYSWDCANFEESFEQALENSEKLPQKNNIFLIKGKNKN